MAGDNDDRDPMEGMFPPVDNPVYHKKKAEFEEQLGAEAEVGVMKQHGYLADRMKRVRKNPPKAAAPTPKSNPAPPAESKEGTGLQVDPSLVTRFPPKETVPEPTTDPVVSAPATAAEPFSKPDIEHPILKRLREDFGIDTIPFEQININGHVFTLRVLDTSSVTSALRFADTLSVTPRENTINLQIALISFAVLAVDEIPLWQMFNVPLGKDERVVVEGKERSVFEPMSPPARIRTIAATSFMDFLNSTATASLSEELWKAYNEKVDPKGSLQGLMNRVSEVDEEVTEDIPLP